MADEKKAAARTSLNSRKGFVQIYNACIDSDMITQYEKLVFITIKSYADRESGKAFPSLGRISKATGMSVSQVRRSVQHLSELGLLDIEHKASYASDIIRNVYTVHDSEERWNISETEEEDMIAVMQEISDDKLREEAHRRGYVLVKKELASGTGESTDASHHASNVVNNISTSDGTTLRNGCQERYTMDDIHALYDYEVLIHDHEELRTDVDVVMGILYDVLNTNRDAIRVSGQDRPAMVVIGKLMKLGYAEILYSIRQFNSVTDRIKNPRAYMLSILYGAKEQMTLDVRNQVQHELYGDNNGVE